MAAGSGAGGGAGGGSVLWTLHVPSLRWTAMYAAKGAAGPNPGSGGAATLASLLLDSAGLVGGHHEVEQQQGGEKAPEETATRTTRAKGGAVDVPGGGQPAVHEAIVLVGGQRADHGGITMPIWVHPLGKSCVGPPPESTPGCARGEACDGATGMCVCAASGKMPPCKPPPAPPMPTLTVEDGALRMIGQAWTLVGVSVVGATAGRLAVQRMAASAIGRA